LPNPVFVNVDSFRSGCEVNTTGLIFSLSMPPIFEVAKVVFGFKTEPTIPSANSAAAKPSGLGTGKQKTHPYR